MFSKEIIEKIMYTQSGIYEIRDLWKKEINNIDNVTLGKKANDLISLEALYNYSTDASGRTISWFEKFEELLYSSIANHDLSSISSFLEKTI